jgi:hypothetical protein
MLSKFYRNINPSNIHLRYDIAIAHIPSDTDVKIYTSYETIDNTAYYDVEFAGVVRPNKIVIERILSHDEFLQEFRSIIELNDVERCINDPTQLLKINQSSLTEEKMFTILRIHPWAIRFVKNPTRDICNYLLAMVPELIYVIPQDKLDINIIVKNVSFRSLDNLEYLSKSNFVEIISLLNIDIGTLSLSNFPKSMKTIEKCVEFLTSDFSASIHDVPANLLQDLQIISQLKNDDAVIRTYVNCLRWTYNLTIEQPTLDYLISTFPSAQKIIEECLPDKNAVVYIGSIFD